MEQLIEILQQIQELSGIALDALTQAAGVAEGAPAEGLPADAPPAEQLPA